MAISPIGNITYINQNTQVNLQNQPNRMDMTLLNLQEHEDKLKEIEEVRTPEDTQRIHKDKQEGKNPQEKRQEGENQNPEETQNETTEENPIASTHRLLDMLA